jgi:hypothetical protein
MRPLRGRYCSEQVARDRDFSGIQDLLRTMTFGSQETFGLEPEVVVEGCWLLRPDGPGGVEPVGGVAEWIARQVCYVDSHGDRLRWSKK